MKGAIKEMKAQKMHPTNSALLAYILITFPKTEKGYS
jgi:hypothetical protein